MITLAGFQRVWLRGQAHHLKPLVHVGKSGVTPELVAQVKHAIGLHELIKVRFLAFQGERKPLAAELAAAADAALVGITGNVAVLYRPQDDPDKRVFKLPLRPGLAGAAEADDKEL